MTDKTKFNSSGKILHPRVQARKMATTLRTLGHSGSGFRQDTLLPPVFNSAGQRLQLIVLQYGLPGHDIVLVNVCSHSGVNVEDNGKEFNKISCLASQ